MISQTAEYALRAMVFLAEEPQNSHAIPELARVTKVPEQYLAKVMQGLVRRGIAVSHRGAKGGYGMSRPAEEITLYDIVDAVDPVQRILKCPLDLPAHRDQLCSLHAKLDGACAHVEETLRGATLADIMAEAALPLELGGHPCPLH